MAQASYPEELLYHPEHDWARVDDEGRGEATLGITWYAQDALGEVVFFDPPALGSTLTKDDSYTEVESVKAVSDLYAPASGTVDEVNDDLTSAPEKVNSNAHSAWMMKITLSDPSEVNALMSAAEYEQYIAEEGGH